MKNITSGTLARAGPNVMRFATPDRHGYCVFMSATLVFDGDCGFCTVSAGVISRWIRPRARISPWQSLDLDALGLTPEECQSAVQWVAENGRISSGGRAMAAALRASPFPWPIIGNALDLPGMQQLVAVIYAWIADNRHRLPGSTAACAPTEVG